MGSKTSVKSKTAHVAHIETLMLQGRVIQWEGNGIYVFNKTAEHFQLVSDIKDLEFKIASDNYGAPTLVRKNQFNELVYWGSYLKGN